MFRKTLTITALSFTILLLFSYWTLRVKKDAPIHQTTKESILINDKRVFVEIADEAKEQILGLSGRERLDDDAGLLFIFDPVQSPGFWMKDMKFPIDIIWIGADGTILGIEKSIAPETYPKNFFPPSPIKYVLEINSGWSEENNIKLGDKLKFPKD